MASPVFLDVQGVRTRHIDTGFPESDSPASGTPVVLLHGIGRSLEDWSATWPALAHGRRVLVPDLIGFGRTDKPDVPYTLAGLARFVRHYLDAAGATGPVALIGNSLGGAVAQQFARLYPERTRALVLVNSAGFGAGVTPALRALSVPGLGEWLMRPSRRAAALEVRSLYHDPAFATPERIAHTFSLAGQPGGARAYLRLVRHLGTWRGIRPEWRGELTRDLAPRRFPTLLLWGEQDRILPASQLDAARAAYPHARWHLFRETGHLPQIERAGAFNRLVTEFLEDHHA